MNEPFFVALDGEGYDGPSGHVYNILVAGWYEDDGRFVTRHIGGRKRPLGSLSVFEFLLRLRQELAPRHPVFVGFALVYDFTHWLKWIPRPKLELALLDRPGYKPAWWYPSRQVWRTCWQAGLVTKQEFEAYAGKSGYGLRLIPGKMLEIVRYKSEEKGAIKVNDVFGYFQKSLVKAIEDWLGPDYPLLPTIRQGKAARGTFETWQKEDILAYTRAELQATVDLCQRLAAAIDHVELHNKYWMGAGSLAQAMFAKELPKNWFKRARELMSDDAADAVYAAYYGGRIETVRYGHAGRVWSVDLNSAYPAAMTTLPDLTAGEWKMIDEPDIDRLPPYGVSFVAWDFPKRSTICPFPMRTAAGTVLYPQRGRGWVHNSLIDVFARYRHTPVGRQLGWHKAIVVVDRTYYFEPATDARPFAWVADYYERRKQYINEGQKGAQLTIKLGINSLYGKCAQKAGYFPAHMAIETRYNGTIIEDNDAPIVPSSQHFYAAGYITAWTQARVLELGIRHHRHLVCFATDAVFLTCPPDIETSKEKKLGGWGVTEYDDFVMVMSGVYFYKTGDKWKLAQRGFRIRDEQIPELLDQVMQGWRDGLDYIEIGSERLVGPRQSLVSDEWYEQLGNWVPFKRRLSLRGQTAKRTAMHPEQNAAEGLVDTVPICDLGWLNDDYNARLDEVDQEDKDPEQED